MYAREPVPHELLRDVREAVTLALSTLSRRELQTTANVAKSISRVIGDASVQGAGRIAIERAAGGIRRVLCDPRELEHPAVIERRVATAMTNRDWMFGRDLIEIVNVE